ncbi:MAG: acetyl-CoA carboxylase, biotin carboxyl carrier protein [Gammaproteobacteria bacterium RIFCSPLOWO2_12_FULL_52_10]|nr:MAG: acetyl-CoA carboxylase, biotin carboxyl carrier protein [Gammaproteobacteria bacterium RIFCSPLOWO2_12_FULL_52_10]
MDIRKVKKLIEMLEESSIAEIEIHEGEESVRVSRHSSIAPAVVQVPQSGADAERRAAASAGTEVGTESGTTSGDRMPEGFKVKSPMVGIFYSSPAPGKPPFVELGKAVVKGDVLCIIEAMKIMNQVEAETSGVIAKIMVENGEPIEYGQPLFVIREEN